ncbi:MAG: mechanosensitive ion channel [bacterium]|nr:mechanosensitive ion channel [bacterium]
MVDIDYQQITTFLTEYGLKVIGALVILIIGRFVAGLVRKGLRKAMNTRQVDPSLVGFLSSLVYALIMAFVFIAALAKFGVQTASFVAILGAAGFAVGMAMQGTLANFASGVMIMVFRPFSTGDFIDAGGVKGVVKDIAIFTTTIATPDNIKILVPNGQIYGGVISNYNGYDQRRVDMVVGVGYGADLSQTMEVIKGVLAADNRVLADPAPAIAVSEMADSSMNLIVRPWVKAADYWGVHNDFQKSCKEALDTAGIDIPYPQTVVHMQKTAD